jgi:hypothetical protein
MGWFGTLLKKAIPKCTPTSPSGLHGRVVTGCGGMGDGNLCLRCGRETYGVLIGESQEELRPEIWPEVEAARNLPNGISTLAAKSDPEFDAWFNSPLADGTLPSWAERRK